jgi:hypothetical protein
MKRQIAKKLTLAKETLQGLEEDVLKRAAGLVTAGSHTCVLTCFLSCKTCNC